ncbi:MAG: hypothetical protein OXC62_13765 [Aestuariivita sp.]|nr:hypothetical protein [Aestuariivita sp.]
MSKFVMTIAGIQAFSINKQEARRNVRDAYYPFCNAENGELTIWHAFNKKSPGSVSFFLNAVGHLQHNIPCVVYNLCPDFPSAQDLDLEINEAQTAVTYHDLMAQHPGKCILRNDLVKLNADKYSGSNGDTSQSV